VLRLFGRSSTATQNVGVTLYASPNVTWSETGLTWNNKPTGTSLSLSATVSGTGNVWYEFDVTDYVKQQKTAGATGVTFALNAAGVTDAWAIFASDEASANRPQLVVTS
jgi:hypothetical protein